MRITRPQIKTVRIVRARFTPTVTAGAKLLRFESVSMLEEHGTKSTAIKDGDKVVDYQDVRITGYLSTFGNTDRDGDIVEPGAFVETIDRYKSKPLPMLVNHRNDTKSVAGSFTTLREDGKGLYVEGLLSNANSPDMIDLRAKVAEGHIRTMSMGGIFYYRDDGRTIFKVELYEGSLTPIPANPMATFSTRELTEMERKTVQSLAA